METTPPPEMQSRLPGAVLIAAAAIMITGAAIGFLAPSLRDAPPFVTDDVAKAAAAIAGNPAAWGWANGLILIAAILTALGLVPISLRFEGRSRPWAMTALVTFAFAAVLETIDRMIAIQVTTWAAQRYPDDTVFTVWEAFSLFDGGLGFVFYILGFAALGLYGVAIVQTQRAIGLGWAFVAVGVIAVLLKVVGGGIPAFVFVGTAAFGAASWQLRPDERTMRGPDGPLRDSSPGGSE